MSERVFSCSRSALHWFALSLSLYIWFYYSSLSLILVYCLAPFKILHTCLSCKNQRSNNSMYVRFYFTKYWPSVLHCMYKLLPLFHRSFFSHSVLNACSMCIFVIICCYRYFFHTYSEFRNMVCRSGGINVSFLLFSLWLLRFILFEKQRWKVIMRAREQVRETL